MVSGRGTMSLLKGDIRGEGVSAHATLACLPVFQRASTILIMYYDGDADTDGHGIKGLERRDAVTPAKQQLVSGKSKTVEAPCPLPGAYDVSSRKKQRQTHARIFGDGELIIARPHVPISR